jgi:glucose-6-phosphate isomerase
MTTTPKAAWSALARHAREISPTHLRDLLPDTRRARAMRAEHDGIVLDFSRQNATPETTRRLLDLARATGLRRRIAAMFTGGRINGTEDRAVLHVALRAPRNTTIRVDGEDVVPAVHRVLDRIRRFSAQVRDGVHRGVTGERLADVVAIGIGGSYLGPEFVAEALATDPASARAARGRRLRFLANVDPIDVTRALAGLDPARTLVVVVSKTFTTAETMLNARAVREWLLRGLRPRLPARRRGDDHAIIAQHMVAVSTNTAAVTAFGIDRRNMFGFWDWVGGRYSVCSAVGALPLALHYGFAPFADFLAGARSLDEHFQTAPLGRNLPVLLGLYGVWNSTVLNRPVRALLPYCQALHRFAAHIQQVDMESNGKGVDRAGRPLPAAAGEVDFGEPGTNGQHSFYQLLHQGRVIPADFIGFTTSQRPLTVAGHPVTCHDELMANFFAQPDALALGLTADAVRAQGVPRALVPHRVFPGNRPSNVILFTGALDPRNTGRLLALYEHRTAVQGFLWDINSFDQWGVQLGKVLAQRVTAQLAASRTAGAPVAADFVPSTRALLARYLGAP